MMGLLTIKPQLGVLLPLVLILIGAWRAIIAATLTAALLVVLSVAIYGVEPWQAWWGETAKWQWSFTTDTQSFFTTQKTTAFSALRLLGASIDAAMAFQMVVAVLVVVATWAVLKGRSSWPLKATVVAFGSVLIAPYVLAYDLAIPLAALVWCLREGGVRAEGLAGPAVVFVWAVPFAITIMLQARGLPVAPLAVALCYAWLLHEAFGWKLRSSERPAAGPAVPSASIGLGRG